MVDCVADPSTIQAAVAEAAQWLRRHGKPAGMGTAASGGRWVAGDARGDTNSWATPDELRGGGCGVLAALLQQLEARLRPQLAAQGFDVGGRASIQLACYPGGGARYVSRKSVLVWRWAACSGGGSIDRPRVSTPSQHPPPLYTPPQVRHADASPSSPGRTITALLYLNPPDWRCQEDGGALALYSCGRVVCGSGGAEGLAGGEPATLVAPLGGRLLVFRSELEHEVLPVHRERHSVTLWLYRAGGTAAVQGRQRAAGESAPDPGGAVALSPSAPSAAAALAAPAAAPAGPTIPSTPTDTTSSSSSSTTSSSMQAEEVASGTIFVAIPAYRDPECAWTLRDLFLKAANPWRVFAGIVWQVRWSAGSA